VINNFLSPRTSRRRTAPLELAIKTLSFIGLRTNYEALKYLGVDVTGVYKEETLDRWVK
jgi:hypothetical protein